jgi:hypothetical protein
MLKLLSGTDMKKQQGNNMEKKQIPAKHITLVKPLKDNKNSKSEAVKAKGGEGCLPIR